jgi:prophage tail gpP-like protein
MSNGTPVTQLPEVTVTATPLPPTSSAGLVLRIQGTDYGGWLLVRVRRSIEEAAAAFACEVSERWPGQSQPWQIKPLDACQVLLDGKVVLTGYVEVYAPSFDGRTHRVEVRGHSATVDASDSSIEIDGGQLQNLTLQEIADRVLKPLGVNATFDVPPGTKLADVQVQQGETAYALLERLCRMQQILVSDDERGNVYFTRVGARRASGTLEQGKNILAATAELDWSERFSKYTVKAQKPNLDDQENFDAGSGTRGAGRAGDGTDDGTDAGEPGGPGDTVVSPSGSATDPAVKRNRPLIIYGDNVMDAQEAAKRAEYELRRRIGRSQRAHVTVQGWTQPDGTLWRIGDLVPITAPWLGLNESLAIAAVEFLKDDGGTRTQLELTLPAAFMPTAQEMDAAAKPASGDDTDTKAAFWSGANQSAPGGE